MNQAPIKTRGRVFSATAYSRRYGPFEGKMTGQSTASGIRNLFRFISWFIGSLKIGEEQEFPYNTGHFYKRLSARKFRFEIRSTPEQIARIKYLAGHDWGAARKMRCR